MNKGSANGLLHQGPPKVGSDKARAQGMGLSTNYRAGRDNGRSGPRKELPGKLYEVSRNSHFADQKIGLRRRKPLARGAKPQADKRLVDLSRFDACSSKSKYECAVDW